MDGSYKNDKNDLLDAQEVVPEESRLSREEIKWIDAWDDFVGKMLKEIRRKDNVDRARGELGNGAARSHDGLSSFDEVLDVGVEVDRDSLSALDYIDEFTTPGAEVNDHVCGINESLKVGTNEDFPHAALKRKLVVGETFSVELSEFIAV